MPVGNSIARTGGCGRGGHSRMVQRSDACPYPHRRPHSLREADCIRCSQAKGLTHTSPGQRPGFPCGFFLLQANGLRHRVLWVRLAQIPRRPRDQAPIPQDNESRFQRSEWSLADKPRALPWAGMNDAVGAPNRPAVHPGLFSWCLSGTTARLNFRKAFVLTRIFRSAAGPQPKLFSKKEEVDRQWYTPSVASRFRIGTVSRVAKPAGRPRRRTACRLGSRRYSRLGSLRCR
jgi:hypothetical protein